MSQATSLSLQPLDKKLRNKLERTIKEARDVAESGALAALKQLEVGQAKVKSLTSDEEKDFRRRLRIHGRQLGDRRKANGEQELHCLVDEIAYEHWHRMLFARFLAENHLLMYPDPDDPVSISLDDCEEMAADEGAKNGWELAARFATKMLPQIFRIDSPVFELELPPENQQRLESLLAELDDEVFTASDSIGWVYQFWQAKRKDEVNASEVKIGARELPAVTQLFTEPYMVSFLLDNSLGAWWAARSLTEGDLRTAESEQELREKAALPGVPLDYLRFVRTPSGNELEGAENTGPWTPAAGKFDAWPDSLADFTTLDPCCGSGHFLVAALLMLTPMRMKLEGLTAREAVDRVLVENLHGLEIDQRCVELAAFALALTAWRFPDAGGYRTLPDLNVACCGLSVSVAKEEWKELAKDNKQLRIALDWMYDEFKDAPVLGSLLNPKKNSLPIGVSWEDIIPALEKALDKEVSEDQVVETAVAAHGLSRAAVMLGRRFEWIITNVPYLTRSRFNDFLCEFSDTNFSKSKHDIATIFLDHFSMQLSDDGTLSFVLPQNWLFLKTYRSFRESLYRRFRWDLVARLGAGAFETITGEVVKGMLLCLSRTRPDPDHLVSGLDTSTIDDASGKAIGLQQLDVKQVQQDAQASNPNSTFSLEDIAADAYLKEVAESYAGVCTGDYPRFGRGFWEVDDFGGVWEFQRSTVSETQSWGGMTQALRWEDGEGELYQFVCERLGEKNTGSWLRGHKAWNKYGISVKLMSSLPVSIYSGELFDDNVAVLIPKTEDSLLALVAYCESDDFSSDVRKVNDKHAVKTQYLLQVPFDFSHWQQVAAEKYPFGLPTPYSDDPTQWIFHGHPSISVDALQVAVARLLGYRWPAELDADMELATDARAWVERSGRLNDLADNDGIVCIPAVGTEQPAEDRLLNLLHRAYEDGRAQEQIFLEKLEAGDESDPVTVDLLRRGWKPSLPDSFPTWRDILLESSGHSGKSLESWLRDKFFAQHCKLFQHRPFIWHIWDGLKDGFSALINYHKLSTKLLETLIYTYLNDWIKRQKQDQAAGVDGSEEKLAAAQWLKERLELILEGESPHDIFVRWKPLEEQPIGWDPDLNDGVRLNIRPWMTVGDVKKKGAGLLRDKPNIHWKKDRGKDVESAPWYQLGPEHGGKEGDRINDHHLTLAEKKAATESTNNRKHSPE